MNSTISAAEVEDDPSLYEVFGTNTISAKLIGLVGIRCAIGTMGMFSSAALIYVTIRNKNLHGTCNLFIATQAFFELLTMANFSYSFFLALIGQNFVTLGQCMPALCWSTFANLMRKLALFLVSLDRLLMVSFPLIFAQKPIIFYWCSMAIVSAYSLFVLYLTWSAALDPSNVDKMVTCTVSDLTDTGAVGQFVLGNGLAIVALSLFNYTLLWAILKWKTDETEKGKATRHYTRQIYKMLLILAVLAIFGWMLNPIIRLLLPLLDPTQLQKFYVSIGLSTLSNITMLLDPPVLYWFSKDYRNAFRKSFGKFLGLPAPQPSKMFTRIMTANPTAAGGDAFKQRNHSMLPATTITNFGDAQPRKLTLA